MILQKAHAFASFHFYCDINTEQAMIEEHTARTLEEFELEKSVAVSDTLEFDQLKDGMHFIFNHGFPPTTDYDFFSF